MIPISGDSHRVQPVGLGVRRWVVCAAALLFATLSLPAQEMFMRIGGQASAMGATQNAPILAGESTDRQYTNWIPVLSMSHGVNRPVSVANPSGIPNHSDLAFTKNLDKTTPSLNLLVNGVAATVTQPIDYVTIDFRTAGTSNVFYRIELQGVTFTSAQIGAAGGTGVPVESLSLFYTKIKWSYVPYVNGKAQATITKGWDVAAAKAL